MNDAVKKICACPYYAHTGFRNPVTKQVVVVPNPGSNQCPFFLFLKIKGKTGHAPCVMEIEEKAPDWNICPLRHDRDVQTFLQEEFTIMH